MKLVVSTGLVFLDGMFRQLLHLMLLHKLRSPHAFEGNSTVVRLLLIGRPEGAARRPQVCRLRPVDRRRPTGLIPTVFEPLAMGGGL